MKRVALGLLIAASAACSKPIPPGPEAGEAYFKALNCRSCHRVGADGGVSGPDLTTVGFRHSKPWLDAWLANPQGWKPDTLMPNPHLAAGARAGVVEYLSTLKGQSWNGSPPWVGASGVDEGRLIFEKAGCVACHGRGGVGGSPNNNVKGNKIPALDVVSQTYTKDELVKKISRGVKPEKADPNGPEPLVFMPPWGEMLKPDEISAVADYLLTLKRAGGEPGPGF